MHYTDPLLQGGRDNITGIVKKETLSSLSPCESTFYCSADFSSVQFSCSVVCDSLRCHEPQYARPPCPSLTPRVHSDSHPPSQWCHPVISSSVIPLSSSPQSLPASESFPMSQFFTWGGQSTGVSALASFLPKNTQDWAPLKWINDTKMNILIYLSLCIFQYFLE